MRIVIAGGGNVGVFIASDLCASGHDVTILEHAPEVVERALASGEHPGVEFVVADACELSALTAANLETADVVAAVTGDDEDNLVVSLLAKQEFGVPRVIARVNHPKNEWLFNQSWGVDVSVSTPHLLTALVEEAVSVGTLVRLLQFEGGKARLVEVTLAEGSPAAGAAVVDLGLPRDCTVVAIVRADHLVVPRGDTLLLAGDEVLVLVTPDAEVAVRSAFVGDETPPQSGPPQGSKV
ncbi:MAG TPA: NAD-binding protein [Acidimicrobiales bacterium]|nr:NAD-binding protein [Acidimicrobiales bacterium]